MNDHCKIFRCFWIHRLFYPNCLRIVDLKCSALIYSKTARGFNVYRREEIEYSTLNYYRKTNMDHVLLISFRSMIILKVKFRFNVSLKELIFSQVTYSRNKFDVERKEKILDVYIIPPVKVKRTSFSHRFVLIQGKNLVHVFELIVLRNLINQFNVLLWFVLSRCKATFISSVS